MLTSTPLIPNAHSVRFHLDGVVKSLSYPVTGAALHIIAGGPAHLFSGGAEVPNNYELYDLKQDQVVTTKPEAGPVLKPAPTGSPLNTTTGPTASHLAAPPAPAHATELALFKGSMTPPKG